MGSISTWELRARVRDDGGRASDVEIAGFVEWGILRKPDDGRWSETDVARAKSAGSRKGRVAATASSTLAASRRSYLPDAG